MLRVMIRLNLTLSDDTAKKLKKHSKGRPRASVARELIDQALAAQELMERRRKLAHDYAAGRNDALELLKDFEPANLEAIGNEAD
jgi:hypothetical protein